MRLSALAGLFVCVSIFAASGSSASAQSLSTFNTNTLKQESFNIGIIAAIRQEAADSDSAEVSAPPEPVIHVVKANETLTDIASQYETTWMRLFYKNEQIAHPDILAIGDNITVPLADEALTERPLPAPPEPVTVQDSGVTDVRPQSSSVPQTYARGSASGNTYTPGYCTWYAKNMRPDLPNNLGNADTWVARAAAQGLPTGSAPRVGAIGQQGMHVVYVQSVNGDGTVTISEMNFQGLYVVSTRTVPAGYFQYIY